MDENYTINHGKDEIEFENRPGSLIPVYQMLQEFGNYSSIRTMRGEEGIYKIVPNNGEHHVVRIDLSENNLGKLSFLYTSPRGRNQIKDKVPQIRKSLQNKLK